MTKLSLDLKDLTPKELSSIYYLYKSHKEDIDSCCKEEGLGRLEQFDIPDQATVKVVQVKILQPSEIEFIKNSEYYKTISSIVEKLQPIVDMIEDAEPNIKQELLFPI